MGRASLKLPLPIVVDALQCLISRPYGPGLIEALAKGLRTAPLSGFPGPMGRASLKLQFGIARVDGILDFPALWAGPH